MDLVVGFAVGFVLALVLIVAACLIYLRASASAPLPAAAPVTGQPAVMVMMIEPFLNQQLREALAAETRVIEKEAQQETRDRVPLQIKLLDAALDVQPERRALFIARVIFSAWNLKLKLQPITELYFGLDDGRVKIQVMNIRLGGINVPRQLIDRFVSEVVASAEAKLNHSLMELQNDTQAHLFDIETTDDLMILKFSSQ